MSNNCKKLLLKKSIIKTFSYANEAQLQKSNYNSCWLPPIHLTNYLKLLQKLCTVTGSNNYNSRTKAKTKLKLQQRTYGEIAKEISKIVIQHKTINSKEIVKLPIKSRHCECKFAKKNSNHFQAFYKISLTNAMYEKNVCNNDKYNIGTNTRNRARPRTYSKLWSA